MSSFLERIASSVVQPEARLQPMLGSIFSPSTLIPATGAFTAQPVETETFATSGPRPIEQYVPSASDSASDRGEDLSPAPENGVLADRGRAWRRDLPLIEAQPPQQAISVRSGRPAHSESFQPLVSLRPESASSPLQSRISTLSPVPQGMSEERSNLARRAAPAPHQPDEIHIHIGRIEVAAIAQPPGRPSSTPARRHALNLGDYLRGSGGRAG